MSSLSTIWTEAAVPPSETSLVTTSGESRTLASSTWVMMATTLTVLSDSRTIVANPLVKVTSAARLTLGSVTSAETLTTRDSTTPKISMDSGDPKDSTDLRSPQESNICPAKSE